MVRGSKHDLRLRGSPLSPVPFPPARGGKGGFVENTIAGKSPLLPIAMGEGAGGNGFLQESAAGLYMEADR